MFSPMMTVLVLAVLWMIVVIPMLVKRNDDRAGERSAARFSSAMRALSAKRSLATLTRPAPLADLEHDEAPRLDPHAQVFVPGRALRADAGRRPVPAAMEATLYPDRIDRADLSEARRQMLARRRRSLILLTAGTVIGLLWGVAAGGMLAWLVALAFTGSFAGYLLFLRNQALHDRERRQARLQRSGLRPSSGYEVTERISYQAESTEVRIDDEDVELRGMADTIDLTGLYIDEQYDERAMRRAV